MAPPEVKIPANQVVLDKAKALLQDLGAEVESKKTFGIIGIELTCQNGRLKIIGRTTRETFVEP